jgi:hypothetical protein
MAGTDSRYNVVVDIKITDVSTGTEMPFSDFTARYHDCPRMIMHAIESAISDALVSLGDQGVVMYGGDEAVAAFAAQSAAKVKLKDSKK